MTPDHPCSPALSCRQALSGINRHFASNSETPEHAHQPRSATVRQYPNFGQVGQSQVRVSQLCSATGRARQGIPAARQAPPFLIVKTVPVTSIQSKNQRIFTLQQTKIGANPSFGGKRYALEPDHVNRRYTSVPFGYNPL
jgi:hypothetical protein